MSKYEKIGQLEVSEDLFRLVNESILPGAEVSSDGFWLGLEGLVAELGPRNRQLIEKRQSLQKSIDAWHKENKGSFDKKAYKKFLLDIGYLKPDVSDFTIETANVDPEIATIYGPQLVVPVMNARFALNAANARFGSLFDALYGTDVISEDDGAQVGGSYNKVRGEKVVAYSLRFLDTALPLTAGSHSDVSSYEVLDKKVVVTLKGGKTVSFKDPLAFKGYNKDAHGATSLLFIHHNLHIELQIDRSHPVGADTLSGMKDIILESAVTVIQDCEDSVAAVDAADKALVYKNWLGLMDGSLTESFEKNGKKMERTLAKDRFYKDIDGNEFSLPGRSLMLVRNVGHLMDTPAVLFDKKPVPEGILDALVTAACSMSDLNRKSSVQNSKTKSVYIVKPKMHGPDEVAFSVELFSRVEKILGLPEKTLKIGVMDEERRTTLNLKACIKEAKDRIIFINTGFLDRTGDEIHTSMEAGPVVGKGPMKKEDWMSAYEDWNVDVGLSCGFGGRAQIGKGMWAKPDEMAAMMAEKVVHPKAGANCAWVPSPTAATLHVMHYHMVDVSSIQKEIKLAPRAKLDDILTLPLHQNPHGLTKEEIQKELENNAQGILGYVVRWIDQGVGCSKVPDIFDVGLMEDRATLRISSQHIANWLHHGICSKDEVISIMKKMAQVVDGQNAHDKAYLKMAPDFDKSIAFSAALELVLEGRKQPNGYTEPVLFRRRLEAKSRSNG